MEIKDNTKRIETFCGKCGKQLIKKGKPFQFSKRLYDTLSGDPILYQEYTCPNHKWFSWHDMRLFRN
jgi:hypothetical protein